MSKLSIVDYRNGKYQGQTSNYLPNEQGVLLDDDMTFIASHWDHKIMQGPTFIYSGHSKFLYGNWTDGLPNGFNVFRSGETILYATFDKGKMIEKFMVVFQKQNLAVIVSLNNGVCEIVDRKQDFTQGDIRLLAEKINLNKQVPKQYFSVMQYLNKNFCDQGSALKTKDNKGEYFFGYETGLGINFDQNFFIKSVGYLDNNSQIIDIGGRFSLLSGQQGDFQNSIVVKYKHNRPAQQIRTILQRYHKRSMFYNNNYVNTNVAEVFVSIEGILKQQLISYIAQQQLQNSRRYTREDLNDSLEYQPPQNKTESQRLKQLREELYQSIRPGNEIIEKKKYPKQPVQRQTSYKPTFPQISEFDYPSVSRYEPKPLLGREVPLPVSKFRAYQNLAPQTYGRNYQPTYSPVKYSPLRVDENRVLKQYKNKSPQRYDQPTKLLRKQDSPYNKLQGENERQPTNEITRRPMATTIKEHPSQNKGEPETSIKDLKTKVNENRGLARDKSARRYNYLNDVNI